MKRIAGTLLLACSMLVLSGLPARAAEGIRNAVSPQEIKFRSNMNSLFTQCLSRQRNVSVKILTGADDAGAAMGKLNETLDSIGGALKTYYGDENGDKITNLYRQYVSLAVSYADVVKKRGDTSVTVGDMRARADQIATLLNSYSPVWKKLGLAQLLREYSDLSVDEINAQNKSVGNVDAAMFAATFSKSLEISGAFVTGIVKQFPEQFVNETK